MANYRGHVFGALGFAVAYLFLLSIVFAVDILPSDRQYFSGYAFPVVLVGISVMFGMLPDIDINSRAQNLFYTIFFMLDAWLILKQHYVYSSFLGLVAMLPIISKHRGWTHSKIAMLLVPLPLLVFPAIATSDFSVGVPYYGAAIVGFASHLYFDGLFRVFRRR